MSRDWVTVGLLIVAIALAASAPSGADPILDLERKADSLGEAGDHKAAAILSSRAVELAAERYGEDSPEVLNSLVNLIGHAFGAGDYILVDNLCRRANSVFDATASPDTVLLESILSRWVAADHSLGRIRQALTHSEALLAVRRALFGNAHVSIVSALRLVGQLHVRLFEYDQAIAATTEAIHIAETSPDIDRSLHADYVANLGMIYKHRGDLLTTDSLMKMSLEIIQDTIAPDEISLSSGQINLAISYLAQNRLEEARPLLQQAYEIRMRLLGPDHGWVATAGTMLATLYWRRGDYEKAEPLFQEAIGINRKSMATGYLGVVRILIELGLMYHEMGRYDNSQALYDTAMTLMTDSMAAPPPEMATCLNRIGNLHRDLGDFAYADSCVSRALEIRSKDFGENYLLTAYSMMSLGQLYIKMDRLEEAEKLLIRAASVFEATLGPLHPSLFEANISLAGLSALKGDADRSRRYYAEALEAYRQVMRAYFIASSERDKLNWIRKYPVMDQSLLTFAAGPHGEPWVRPALEMALRGKCAVIDAVAAARETAFCSDDPGIDNALKGRADVCREIANVSLGHIPRSWRQAVDDSLNSLYVVLDSVESELSKRCSEFGSTRAERNITLDDVIAAIPDGTVFWEFVRYVPYDHRAAVTGAPDPRYLAFVLTGDGQYRIADIGDAHRVDSLVFAARSMIDGAGAKAYGQFRSYLESRLKDILALLYSDVFAPLRELSQGCRTVIIAPDGALNLIPFEIMVDSSGAYAVESYIISYASSARDLVLRGGRIPPSDEVVIVSDPDFDNQPEDDYRVATYSAIGEVDWVRVTSGALRTAVDCLGGEFAAVPFTRYEAERVRRSFSQAGRDRIVMLDGMRASEQALKHLAAPPEVLHMATHGFTCLPDSNDPNGPIGNPLVRCGLVLAGANLGNGSGPQSFPSGDDGILTALEVSGLNLVGSELVTLSACESGTGDIMGGEGVFGLRRSFQHAGARTIVMSMFAVPDESTAELMERFYVNWLSGQPKASALRNASLSILRERRIRAEATHPLFWGGFILVGDPD